MAQLLDSFQIPGFSVSEAGAGDIPELIALINQAFAYQDEAKGQPRIDAAGLTKKMGESNFLVWRDSQQIVACCYVESDEQSLHFGLLSIVPSLRGGKLAPRLLVAIEGYARAQVKTSIELQYMSQAPWLEAYYQRFGFRATGQVRDLGWSKLFGMRKSLSS